MSLKRDNTRYLWIRPEVNSQAESASLRSKLDRFRLWIFSTNIDLWPANPASLHFQKSENIGQFSNYPQSLIRFSINQFLLEGISITVVTYQWRITQSKVVHQYGGGPMRDLTWKRSVYILRSDNGLGPGWFRFEGAGGTRMASTCLHSKRCGARLPGWFIWGHPIVADGQSKRGVCFRGYHNCCLFSTTIKVRNCSSFYVYYLDGTPFK